MISMKKSYKTRDGRAVRVLCVDGKTQYPVVYLSLSENGKESLCNADINGSYGHGDRDEDLIEIKPSVVFWVNARTADQEVIHYTSEDGARGDYSDSLEDWDIIARRVEIPIEEQEK